MQPAFSHDRVAGYRNYPPKNEVALWTYQVSLGTPRSGVLAVKLRVTRQVNKSTNFKEFIDALPCQRL
jgi:hypothetical protein